MLTLNNPEKTFRFNSKQRLSLLVCSHHARIDAQIIVSKCIDVLLNSSPKNVQITSGKKNTYDLSSTNMTVKGLDKNTCQCQLT
jgi:hypothetical protein